MIHHVSEKNSKIMLDFLELMLYIQVEYKTKIVWYEPGEK